MFAGFRDVDSASSGGASSNCSPTCLGSSAASSRSFGSNAKARLQDKQIEKGKAIMMRDYIPTHINIMLYGESGLGKTTCIKNLIGNWEVEKMGISFGRTGRTSLELFKQDPENLKIQLKPLRSEEANRDLLISFQDMPGWGDDINLVNSLRLVVGHLLKQRQLDFHAQDGGFPVHGGPNHRGALQNAMTVCLYFVPPHRIKPVDWIMMSAISKLCAVVPVISKADTFTAKEMADFKREMLQVITSAAMKSPRITAPLEPRTSGCGAATDNGIKSTLNTNQKMPPMSPSAAAALKDLKDATKDAKDVKKPESPVKAKVALFGGSPKSSPKASPRAPKEEPATKPATPATPPTSTPTADKKGPAAAADATKKPAAATTTPAGPTPAAAGPVTYVAPSAAAAAAEAAAAKAAAAPAAEAAAAKAAAAPAAEAAKADVAAKLPSSTSVPKPTNLPIIDGELAVCIELARDLGLETYTFSPEALDAIEADPSQLPPFAVVGSPDMLPADAPEVDGMCCPQGQGSNMPRELWPGVGEPYRRYAWGTAFPLNRSHSDLIILKQLLTGHCNTAIYDLLDDSWMRACLFAEKYRKLLLTRTSDTVRDLLTTPHLLDPLVDEVCSNGKLTPLEDRLRDEEQKKLQLELARAACRLKELEETVKTQRRALSSMQQQLSTVLNEKSQGRFSKLFAMAKA